jgi:tryptophan synthase alpha subunit
MSSRPVLGSTQPTSQWVRGALSPRLKRPGREANHSPPTSAEVKKMLIYISTPYTPSWRIAQLVKHRDNFIYLLSTPQNSHLRDNHSNYE